MGYLHIQNLYKDQTILMFKECYALEKIHGTSTHISWNYINKTINFFSGGESHEKFVKLFDLEHLKTKFEELFLDSNVIIYGEAYGGKQQGMSKTYGNELKFIAFDVLVDDMWLSVPNAENVANKFNLEFVDYVKTSTKLEDLDAERDKESTQAVRNGCGHGKAREGVVLRPLVEFKTNNGSRVICKHKGAAFDETKTHREVSQEEMKVMVEAKEIAEEYVTEMRLNHVLDKLPQDINIESMKLVIDAMVEDVYREAEGEIVKSKEVTKQISIKTAIMFKKRLQRNLVNNNA